MRTAIGNFMLAFSKMPFNSILIPTGIILSILILDSCAGQEEEQLEKESNELAVEKRLTQENMDSVYAASCDALIRKYNAFLLGIGNDEMDRSDEDRIYTYEVQRQLDTVGNIAIHGYVEDIGLQGDKVIIELNIYHRNLEIQARINVSDSLLSSLRRGRGLSEDSCLYIIKYEKTVWSTVRTIHSEISDYSITESGELDYSSTRHHYIDEDALFLYGELIDFVAKD